MLSDTAHADEITFELATLLLRGETLEMVDDVGRTWQATASTLHRRQGADHEILLEGADAFDVLTALARGLTGGVPKPASEPDISATMLQLDEYS